MVGIIFLAWVALMIAIRCNAENIIKKSTDVLRELEKNSSSTQQQNKGDA